ncbi:vWA domain-containing protein [Celeribacter sp.]|uniref:vWA domain-containing protein n=1 Tax=Celeribacter sp. TaxID=1890673 RepID=UPI003A8F3132
MFLPFLSDLRSAGVPVSLREYLAFLEGLDAGLVTYDAEGFYYFARAALVKDERHLDRFDQVFSKSFKGLEGISSSDISAALGLDREIPEDWLRREIEKNLSPEERDAIERLGGFDALMETLKKRLEEQKGRHQGGSKWVGTGGTSPFGAYGSNPEGVRIGQDRSRQRRAVKVWDKREFRNLDDRVELGTRNIKIAMKRLRKWARDGAHEELDLDTTIRASAEAGYIDVRTRPERRNAVKVLMFFDVGGSMDDHIKVVEELFSAARAEFKHLEYYYFHNCLYEGVWRDNARRWNAQTPTQEVFNTYGRDYKVIFVGDASMSPYEVALPGGANEHWNEESGETWLRRAREAWPDHLWLNPVPQAHWPYTQSIAMIREIFEDRMVPMTLEGLERGFRVLGK